MAPGSPSLPTKRPRNNPGPSASSAAGAGGSGQSQTSAATAASRAKRKRAQELDDDDAAPPAGEKKRKSAGGAKGGNGGGTGGAGSSVATSGKGGATNSGNTGGDGAEKEEPPKSRLDFNKLPPAALRTFILAQNMCPHISPSPYSNLPAPLPQTLYTNPPVVPPPSRSSRPERTAILADVQAFHEVMAAQAREVWDRTVVAGTGGVREGEVVTGFLYACKVGDRVLKIVPPS